MQDFIVVIHTPGKAPQQVIVQASSQAEAEAMAMKKWGANGNVPLTVGPAAGQEDFANALKASGAYFDAQGSPIGYRSAEGPPLNSMAGVAGSANQEFAGSLDAGDEPPGGGLGNTSFDFEKRAPLAAYYRALQSKFGDVTQPGLFNQGLREQSTGAQATFMGREALGLNPGAGLPDRQSAYQDYTSGAIGAGKGYSGDANQAFREIQGGGMGRQGTDPAALAGYLNPSNSSQAGAGYELARQARRGQFSGLLDQFIPDDFDLYSQWLAKTGGSPVDGNSWFDTLQKRLGVR